MYSTDYTDRRALSPWLISPSRSTYISLPRSWPRIVSYRLSPARFLLHGERNERMHGPSTTEWRRGSMLPAAALAGRRRRRPSEVDDGRERDGARGRRERRKRRNRSAPRMLSPAVSLSHLRDLFPSPTLARASAPSRARASSSRGRRSSPLDRTQSRANCARSYERGKPATSRRNRSKARQLSRVSTLNRSIGGRARAGDLKFRTLQNPKSYI